MEDDIISNPSSPTSLKQKLKQSLCFSCCFPGRRRNRHHQHLPVYSPPPSDNNPTVIWIRTKGPHHDHSLSDIKEKCRSILGLSGNKHKRFPSMEFSYDPLSYSLNFEDGIDCDDEAPLKRFSARLPPSPPMAATAS